MAFRADRGWGRGGGTAALLAALLVLSPACRSPSLGSTCPTAAPPLLAPAPPPAPPTLDRLVAMAPALRSAMDAAAGYLETTQQPDGRWTQPVESDAEATAAHLLLDRYLGRADPSLDARMVRYLRHEQGAEGGWRRYPGGPPDLDLTVTCYLALRAAGTVPDDPAVSRARAAIAALGGIGRVGMGPRVWLAFLGQIPLSALPVLPAWLACLPAWVHPNLYDLPMVRTLLLPLGLLVKHRAVRPLSPEGGVPELSPGAHAWRIDPVLGWLSTLSAVGEAFFPPSAVDRAALDWLRARQEADGSLMGYFAPTCAFLMALDAVGGDGDRMRVDRGVAALRSWVVEDDRGAMQTHGPADLWTTASGLFALLQARGGEAPGEPALRAADWLVAKQARRLGDWARRTPPGTGPGGWDFGGVGDLYPDGDDAGMAVRALTPLGDRHPDVLRRGVRWLLAMQDRSGGWAAWDRGNRGVPLAAVERLAPGTSDTPDEDLTARVLQGLAPLRGTAFDEGGRVTDAVARGVGFLWRTQRDDGSWDAHWGLRFAYGTAYALLGLAAAGVEPEDPRAGRAVAWLESARNPDGGWGESKASYRTGRFERGVSNPAVTALAVEALIAVRRSGSPAVAEGLAWLLSHQEPDGSWQDREWNGVMVPARIYLRYHLIPTCVAVGALAAALDEVHAREAHRVAER